MKVSYPSTVPGLLTIIIQVGSSKVAGRRLPREVVEGPSLEVFKRRVGGTSGHGSVVGLAVLC